MNNRSIHGVPENGTPIFLGMVFFCGLLAGMCGAVPACAATAPDASAAGTTLPAQRVVLTADGLTYAEPDQITARGNVRLWYAQVTLTADSAWADLTRQRVRAEGQVVLVEEGREIHCAALDYDLQDGSARAQHIFFATDPWFFQGETIEKQGRERVLIGQPHFTTCNARRPHYHITAQRIDVVLGDRITAHHAVFYIGTTPLFYLPWFQRSIKDNRPPFSVRAGYNNYEGAYARLRFNYYLLEENYGSLQVDLMQLRGWGAGLEQHFKYTGWGQGRGLASLFYVKDSQLARERWTAKLEERHEFSPQDLLQMNVDYVSDRSFSRDFASLGVDTYQQKSALAYSRRKDNTYLGISVQDVESLDVSRGIYLPSYRDLPLINYSLSSQRIAQWGAPVYFNLSSSFRRAYERLRLKESLAFRYQDIFQTTPTLTQTYNAPLRVLTQPSLSASLAFPINGNYKETDLQDYPIDTGKPRGDVTGGYATRFTLTNKWVYYQKTNPTHLLQSNLSYGFTRSWSVMNAAALAFSGVSQNNVGLNLDYYMGNFFRLQTQTGYDLLKRRQVASEQAALVPLTFNGFAGSPALNLNWQGVYQWDQERFTSGYLSAATSGRGWRLSVYGSYAYAPEGPQPHTVFTTVSGGLDPWQGLSLDSSVQMNVTQGRLNRVSLGVSQDLHCWALQGGFSMTVDGAVDFGLGISLKAFPEIKAGTGGPEIALGQ